MSGKRSPAVMVFVKYMSDYSNLSTPETVISFAWKLNLTVLNTCKESINPLTSSGQSYWVLVENQSVTTAQIN